MAYVSGETVVASADDKTQTPGYVTTISSSVRVLDLKTGEDRQIFAKEPIIIPNEEKQLKIHEVAFDPSGKIVAISLTDSIVLYDLSSNTIKTTLESNNQLTTHPAGAFAMRNVRFSPDGQRVTAWVGYYEGSEDVIFEVATGKLLRPDWFSYLSGKAAVGWLDNTHLLMHEFMSWEENKPSKFYSYDVTSRTSQLVFEAPGYVRDATLEGGVVTLIHAVIGNSDPALNKHVLMSYDLKSKQLLSLYQVNPRQLKAEDFELEDGAFGPSLSEPQYEPSTGGISFFSSTTSPKGNKSQMLWILNDPNAAINTVAHDAWAYLDYNLRK
jgi:hypothetical protein